jgi:hypothetical protein
MTKQVEMICKATSPQIVYTVGEVQPEEIFKVSETEAKKLEKGLYERVKSKKAVKEVK